MNFVRILHPKLQRELDGLSIEIITSRVASITVRPDLFDGLAESQAADPDFATLFEKAKSEESFEFNVKDGILRMGDRLCIPNKPELKQLILSEAHNTPYSVHPGSTKMHQDLKMRYRWSDLKRNVTEYVQKCLNCLMVKAEHKLPAGEFQTIALPSWKWEDITMDFVVRLPKAVERYDSI